MEKHNLGDQIYETVKAHLSTWGMTMCQSPIVNATWIAAPISTKNKQGTRDPEMHQIEKCNQWYYAMKICAGIDKDSSLIHSVVITDANVHDLTQLLIYCMATRTWFMATLLPGHCQEA
jgi:transposase, IS5 family